MSEPPRTPDEFLERMKVYAGPPQGRPLMNPFGAVKECSDTAWYLGQPLIRATISKVWREYTHGELTDEMYLSYDSLLLALPTLLHKADVYLWSREMKELAGQEAASYPFSDTDIWTPELLGVDPAVMSCLYWAQEVDWGIRCPEGVRFSPPEGSTLTCTIIMYVPAMAREAARMRLNLPPQSATIDTIHAFNIINDCERGLNVLVPYVDTAVVGASLSNDHESARQLYGTLRFLQSPYIGFVKHALPRPMRRKAARDGLQLPQGATVIMLRRKASDDKHAASEEADWSCRWIVRGHWRNQWYASEGIHRPVWIAPYVKGPDEKPLKMPGEKVFTVAR